jgi:hypothetical protein
MDLTTHWHTPDLDVETVRESGKCRICGRRTADCLFAVHENAPPSIPGQHGQTWFLCEECASAVVTQVERSPLRSPLRIRIAVGIVAAERMPQRRRTVLDLEFWEEMPRQQLDGLIAAFVVFLFVMPPLVFLLVTALTIAGFPGH